MQSRTESPTKKDPSYMRGIDAVKSNSRENVWCHTMEWKSHRSPWDADREFVTDTDQQGGVANDCHGHGSAGGEDRISALPDDLLHAVLLHLDSTADAARTNVLSSRWRHVWAHLPELCFRYRFARPVCIGTRDLFLGYDNGDDPVSPCATTTAPLLEDCIRLALAAYMAPTMRRLEITVSSNRLPHVTVDNVSSWMRFASQRLTGELELSLPHFQANKGGIVLPVCERVTSMAFNLYV